MYLCNDMFRLPKMLVCTCACITEPHESYWHSGTTTHVHGSIGLILAYKCTVQIQTNLASVNSCRLWLQAQHPNKSDILNDKWHSAML